MTATPRIDHRPRCTSTGLFHGDDVPCDLHDGHDERKHQWDKPMSFERYVWTDHRRTVRPE